MFEQGLPEDLMMQAFKTVTGIMAYLPIANIDTRLAALSSEDQERIMNWGYAVCDLAVRSYLEEFKNVTPANQFPFPGTGLGG